MSAFMMQRLADPTLCAACYSCHEECPMGAIVIRHRRVAVDAAKCTDCGDCVAECGTDAIAVLRRVPADAPYSIEEQLAWDELPPEGMD